MAINFSSITETLTKLIEKNFQKENTDFSMNSFLYLKNSLDDYFFGYENKDNKELVLIMSLFRLFENENFFSNQEKMRDKLSEIGNFLLSDDALEIAKKINEIKIDATKAPKDLAISDGFILVNGIGQINNFYISKYQVTQSLYEKVIGKNPSKFKGEYKPVEQISWYSAIKFCNELSKRENLTSCYSIDGNQVDCDFFANGYRLPTVSEWNLAAKSKENFIYSGSNNIDEVAWYIENSDSRTHDVGQKQANENGVYDMSGNVREWCWDLVDENNRCTCGGSFTTAAETCKISHRGKAISKSSFSDLGIRLVRTIL